MERVRIWPATPGHTEGILRIARSNRDALGFTPRAAYDKAVAASEILVATAGVDVVGFVKFHFRRDGQATVYEIAVSNEWRRQGIGRSLLRALLAKCGCRGMRVLRLQCPCDLPANEFYGATGWRKVGTNPGRSRALAIYEQEAGR